MDPNPQVQARNVQTSEIPQPVGEVSLSDAARLLAQRRSELRQQQAPTDEPSEPAGEPAEEIQQEEAETLAEEVTEPAAETEPAPEGDAAEPEEAAQPEDDDALLVLDGEEIPLKDVRQWREGAMRAEDYQRKTQALAQSAQAISAMEQDLTRFGNVMAMTYQKQSAAIVKRLQQYGQLNWEALAEKDPNQYRAQRARFEATKTRYEGLQRDFQGFLAEYDRTTQQSIAMRAQAALPEIKQRIRGWNDGVYAERRTFLSETYRGADPSVINKITDPWFWELVNDAHTYRKGKEIPKKAAKIVKRTPGVNVTSSAAPARAVKTRNEEANALQSMRKMTTDRAQEDQAVAILRARRNAKVIPTRTLRR